MYSNLLALSGASFDFALHQICGFNVLTAKFGCFGQITLYQIIRPYASHQRGH
jgi:hypothetical protein